MPASPLPFEDEPTDILAKALRGRESSPRLLAEELAVDPEALRPVLRGEFGDGVLLRRVATALALDAEGLLALAVTPAPEAEPTFPGLHRVTMNYPATGEPRMTVNTYWLALAEPAEAIVFDAGSDAAALRADLAAHHRQPVAFFLTHDHPDHVEALAELRAGFPAARVFAARDLSAPGAVPWPIEGPTLDAAPWLIKARSTPGHAEDGVTYVVRTTDDSVPPIAFVGDAIFARSAGGMAPEVYADGQATIRREILSLPAETILAPGHGPLSTVAHERAANPFFAVR